MHLYFITKGIKKDVDDFINQLVGKWLPFKWREKKEDPMQDLMVQLSIRPIQLWEVGFPQEHKDVVLATILGKEGGQLKGNDGKKPTDHKLLNWLGRFVAKTFGAKPIGEYKTDIQMPIHRGAVAVMGLGLKDDYIMDTGVEGL